MKVTPLVTISESRNNNRNPNWNLTELQLVKHTQWDNKETETITMEKGREREYFLVTQVLATFLSIIEIHGNGSRQDAWRDFHSGHLCSSVLLIGLP